MPTLKKPLIAISTGDLNGIGIEIALHSHNIIKEFCSPLYCISQPLLEQAASLLELPIPNDFITYGNHYETFEIKPGHCSAGSGAFSFESFRHAIALCEANEADALTTLPINKEAWDKAGIHFKGHTDYLRKHFQKDAIMMMGCEQMYVALFTEHLPFKEVAAQLSTKRLKTFMLDLHKSIGDVNIGVCGLNPHAGDNGILGDEERLIETAINEVNTLLGKTLFFGPLVPDIAFTPKVRRNITHYLCMYHDQGLIPLKALYFDESINISLNLPIIRTSVDHGTAFDIAYKQRAHNLSYINAIKAATALHSR